MSRHPAKSDVTNKKPSIQGVAASSVYHTVPVYPSLTSFRCSGGLFHASP